MAHDDHTFIEQFTHPGTVLGATVNLAVTTIGAGVLSLPVAFQSAGILLALGVLLLIAVFTVLSIKYIAECVEKLDLSSYEELSRDLLGPKFETIARWMLILYLFGACVGYVVLIGELLDPLSSHLLAWFPFIPELWVRQVAMALFWLVTMFPLSLTNDLNQLAYTSFLAIIAAGYLCVFIIYRFMNPFEAAKLGPHIGGKHVGRHAALPVECRTVVPQLYNINFMLFLALPIMMYSYDCQTLVFQLYHSVRNPSHQKMTRIGAYAITISTTAYFCIGVFGYLSFGDCVKGNILLNYDPRLDTGAAVAYLLYCTPVVMAYAISLYPCRDSIFHWKYNISPGSPVKVARTPFFVTSIALSVGCLLVAVFIPGILTVISLLGGICSSTLCFTYPALYALRMNANGLVPADPTRKFLIYVMLALGVFGGIFGTVVAVYKTWLGYD